MVFTTSLRTTLLICFKSTGIVFNLSTSKSNTLNPLNQKYSKSNVSTLFKPLEKLTNLLISSLLILSFTDTKFILTAILDISTRVVSFNSFLVVYFGKYSQV